MSSIIRDNLRRGREQRRAAPASGTDGTGTTNNAANGHTPPAAAATAATSEKQRGQCHPVEADPRVILTYACGHKIGVRHLQGSSCSHCVRLRRRQQRERKEEQGGSTARQRRAAIPRLPDGSMFAAAYDAMAERWTGTLRILGITFEAEAPGVFTLMETLDRRYRESIRQA